MTHSEWFLLPGELDRETSRQANDRSVEPIPQKPLLYGPKGEPLTKRRPLGFRPEDMKR